MRKIVLCVIVILSMASPSWAGLIETRVGSLPTSGPTGMARVVTDATTDSDCTVGGASKAASFVVLCTYNGSGWYAGASLAGSVTIAAAATTVTVSTTAVTANSQIFITEDSTLGTKLSVTCNTTISRTYAVTTRTAGTSFVISASAAPVTNPACLNYLIVN